MAAAVTIKFWFLLLFLLQINTSLIYCTQEDSDPYAFYLFENMDGCVKTFQSELKVIKQLQAYKSKLELQKKRIQAVQKNWHTSKSVLNPIDSFYRLLTNNAGTRVLIYDTLNDLSQFQVSHDLNTTYQDYHGALKGLLLLQDTYTFC